MLNYAQKFPEGHWSFLGPGCEEKWYGTATFKPDRQCNKVAERMMMNFSESGDPVFRGSNALNR